MLDQIPTAEETEMSCIFKTKQFTILIERSAAETKRRDLKCMQFEKHSMLMAFSLFLSMVLNISRHCGNINSDMQLS